MKKPKRLRAKQNLDARSVAKARKYVKFTVVFTGLAVLSTLTLLVWAIIQARMSLRPTDQGLLLYKNILGVMPFAAAIPGLVFGILTLKQEVSSEPAKKLWTFAFVLLAVCLSYLMFFPIGYLHFRLWTSVGPLTVMETAGSPDGTKSLIVYDVPKFKGPLRELWIKDNKTGETKFLVRIADHTILPKEVRWSKDGQTVDVEYAARKIYHVDIVTGKELNGKILPYDPEAEARARLRAKAHPNNKPASPGEKQPPAQTDKPPFPKTSSD